MWILKKSNDYFKNLCLSFKNVHHADIWFHYTGTPRDKLKPRLKDVIAKCYYNNVNDRYKCFALVRENSQSQESIQGNSSWELWHFCWHRWTRVSQTFGTTIGTECGPLLADLFFTHIRPSSYRKIVKEWLHFQKYHSWNAHCLHVQSRKLQVLTLARFNINSDLYLGMTCASSFGRKTR